MQIIGGIDNPGFSFLVKVQNDETVLAHIVDGYYLDRLYEGAEEDIRDGRFFEYGRPPAVFGTKLNLGNIERFSRELGFILTEYNEGKSELLYCKSEGSRITCILEHCVLRFITTDALERLNPLFERIRDEDPDHVERILYHGNIMGICGIMISEKVIPLITDYRTRTIDGRLEAYRHLIEDHISAAIGWIHSRGFAQGDTRSDNIGWDTVREQFVLFDLHDSSVLEADTMVAKMSEDYDMFRSSIAGLR